MNPEVKKLYDASLEIIGVLIELDPAPDSAEGRLLVSLSAAVEEFEKAEFPEFNRPPP